MLHIRRKQNIDTEQAAHVARPHAKAGALGNGDTGRESNSVEKETQHAN